MISVESLKESIYRDIYFSKSAGKLTVQNEEKPAEGILSFIEMQSKGTFIELSNSILKETRHIYQVEDRDAGRISYRRDCDGICLLEVDGRNILLFVEVKSGFNEIKKKAFEQLVSSYIKIRSILQSIDGYDPKDYEEMGLVVSYPPSGNMSISSTSMIEMKKDAIAPSALDKLNNAYTTKLRVDKEVFLDLSDYKVNACHVNPSLYNPMLHVKHIIVRDQVPSDTIDLDSYL